MAFAALLTVLVLIPSPGGLLGAEVKSSIIGGTDAERNKWPWMAHLVITDDAKPRATWRCGGSIIDKQWVLTAASCWKRVPAPDMSRSMVWVGAYELGKGGAEYMGIMYFMAHPKFRALSTGGYVDDIALVKLDEPIPDAHRFTVVSLPKYKVNLGSSSECWIAGWGDKGTDKPLAYPETLQQLTMPIISDRVCQKKRPELTSGMLCAGKKGKDACKGDYGGPLMCKEANGLVQVGIMSYSDCGDTDRPGVYTKVSDYLDFIEEYGPHSNEALAEM